MEDKLIVVVCGYPELYDTTSYFYKNRNKKDLAWNKMSEEVRQSVVNLTHEWTEFHVRMKQISCANEASKLKMFKRPTSRE